MFHLPVCPLLFQANRSLYSLSSLYYLKEHYFQMNLLTHDSFQGSPLWVILQLMQTPGLRILSFSFYFYLIIVLYCKGILAFRAAKDSLMSKTDNDKPLTVGYIN